MKINLIIRKSNVFTIDNLVVGTKFITVNTDYNDKIIVYKIESISDNDILISYKYNNMNKLTLCSIQECKCSIRNGSWKLLV